MIYDLCLGTLNVLKTTSFPSSSLEMRAWKLQLPECEKQRGLEWAEWMVRGNAIVVHPLLKGAMAVLS